MKSQINVAQSGSEMTMKPTPVSFCNVFFRAIATLALLAAVAVPSTGAAAEAKQKNFATPEEASSALVGAVKAGDAKALMDILGPGSKDIVQSGDAVADKAARERFVKAYAEANKLEKSADKAVVNIGKDSWPFPVPIVKDGAGWRFDAKAGKEEILNRRIGGNELSVMQVAQAYVDAQREYYLLNPQKDKLLHYAQNFNSSQGKRDGLYFPTKAGEKPSPLGSLVADARAEGYSAQGASGKRIPYHGYYYRILKSQGPDAPGGAYDYVAQGRMIGGHALIAWPASYGNSGVMTFLVNHDGAVYEKDLGPDTAATAQKIVRFNPDKNWKRN
jgi:hypothetical protein